MTNFWVMMWATASGVAKLPGINNVLLPGRFHNGRLDILPVAVWAGVGVVNILPDDILGRDDFQRLYDFLADLGHSVPTLRANQLLTLQTMLHLLRGDSLPP